MASEPCQVCGCTELKLIDGFYYCVECDTQNTNVRETVVDHKSLGDGTFALSTRRKVKIQDTKIEMSPEWYKWHAYNFIILGLADELVAAGANPSFKLKLLWIWTRYVKKYQNKDDLGLAKTSQEGNDHITLASIMVEENSNNTVNEDDDEGEIEENDEDKPVKAKSLNNIIDGSRRDIKFLSKGVILAMLYLALNLDESDIQLSHLYRFLKEKHLNFSNIQRFVPDDIHVKTLDKIWTNFIHSKIVNVHFLRALTMSLLRKLDLGTPKVPNLRKMIDNIILELCLPNDIKPLVYSLMHLYRCDFLDVSDKSKERLCTVPDYEGVVMSYVLVAIKLCFGLDGDYEERLSDAVDKINVDRDLQRSHRNGKYTEPSSRLFSFREWCNYLQFRKITLSKCCLYMAEQYCLDIDDQVYIEHTNDRPQKAKDLQDETAMDLINKIPESNEGRVIPKHHFLPTLTPTYDYTDIVVEHSQDPELRYLLSEDFTQYSLKYACENLELLDENAENIIKGVSENRKITTNNLIMGSIVMKKSKTKMVYVKNCENKNWMKTKPPTIKHVESDDVQNTSTDKESDHGYDSENPTSDKDIANETEIGTDITDVSMIEKEKVQDTREFIITEEENEKNIFDDSFEELDLKDEMEQANDEDPDLPYDERPAPHNESFNDDRASITDMSDNENMIPVFNPETFDRDQTIKELVLMACRKYKIPVPSEYRNREPRKRKADVMRDEDINREPRKRTRTSAAENKQKISELVTGYYEHQRFDLFNKLKNEVNMVIRNSSIIGALEPIPNDTANITNANVTQPELLNATNVDVAALSARTSMMTENLENQSAINPQTSVLQTEGDKEQNADKTNEIEEVIDEQTEKKLFEDEEEMNINELIPKVDPKFDDKKYDTEQLYLKMKMEEEIEEDFDMTSLLQDPKVDEILNKKLEEGKTGFFSVAKPENIKTIKTKYESDSDDEVPLKALQEEKKMIEARIAWEEEFEPLINKENFTEYKYWFRHYDTEFMARSKDWHKKFDEELKENTPSSFYFVIKECATVVNSTPFNLYRHMQNLEKFISARAKYLD